jgi:hypothetical protein
MRSRSLLVLTLLGGMAFGAVIPRKAPEFSVQLVDGKQQMVSQYRGKVLCLVFILTT